MNPLDVPDDHRLEVICATYQQDVHVVASAPVFTVDTKETPHIDVTQPVYTEAPIVGGVIARPTVDSAEPLPAPQVPSAVLIEEFQTVTDQSSRGSRLVSSQEPSVEPATPVVLRHSEQAKVIEDGIKLTENDVMDKPQEGTGAATVSAPGNLRLIDMSQYTNDQGATTIEGTVALDRKKMVMEAILTKQNNFRLIDVDNYVKDPLAVDETESLAAKLSMQAILVPKSTTVTTSGTLVSVQEEVQADVEYAPDRIIVKFKSGWPNGLESCAQGIHEQGLAFKDYLSDGSSSLDQLNRICRVKRIKSLYRTRHSFANNEEAMNEARTMGQIRTHFARRTQRANAVMQPPELYDTYVLEVPPDSDIERIADLYTNDPHVEFAQPDYRLRASVFPATAPNDPLYQPLQWPLNNTGQTDGTPDADLDAPDAWPLNVGDGIVVAVVDTGVDYEHVDLADNIWVNPGEDLNSNGVVDGANNCPTISGDFNCLDDDGNGQVDDIRGYDFAHDDNDPIDFVSHGTFVAGIIAAVTDNGLGVASIAPGAKIMPVKGFADDSSAFISDLAAGIVYAAINGADVINNSWGCLFPCPSNPVAEAAVSLAYGMGAIVVFSAGNDALDVEDFSPQNMKPEVITVAATDHDDLRSWFSNTGTLLDLSAPGEDVVSTFPFDNYAFGDGTSFSSPYVAGVAALVIAEHPSFSSEQYRLILRDSSDDIDVAGFDTNTGAGRVNANEALTLARVIPNLASIGNKSVNTGTILEFSVTASDARNDPLTLTATIVGGASVTTIGGTFIDNGDGTGLFSWSPAPAQAGLNPSVIFSVFDSPGGFSDSETILITVNLGSGICGNTILEPPDEECDDGNIDEGDGCSSSCDLELCGDGDPDFGEQCDDGGLVNGDGCNASCGVEFCGDSIVNNNGTEECDDGNIINNDLCSNGCLENICLNGRIDVGEQCDDGMDTAFCDLNCMRKDTSCGNTFMDGAEECDDGNVISGDGCSGQCAIEFCGDNIVNNVVETCDDGVIPPQDGDGCNSICLREFCGNNLVENYDPYYEECDYGDTINGDGCSAACLLEALADCGNDLCESQRGENCVSCFADCGYCRGLRPR